MFTMVVAHEDTHYSCFCMYTTHANAIITPYHAVSTPMHTVYIHNNYTDITTGTAETWYVINIKHIKLGILSM